MDVQDAATSFGGVTQWFDMIPSPLVYNKSEAVRKSDVVFKNEVTSLI